MFHVCQQPVLRQLESLVHMARADRCSRCPSPLGDRFGTSRYCRNCAAAYMREWRKTHPLTPEQKRKDNARSYAGVYKRRGKIREQPCGVCGGKAQMHHPDYDRPLDVVWLCRVHHLELHNTGVPH